MRTDQAKKVFAELMKRAQQRELTDAERKRLTEARQLLRRRRRPAMNSKKLFEGEGLRFEEGETAPKLGRSSKEALTMAGRGRRPELLKEGKTFDETRLVKSPLFAGRGGRQKRLGENPSLQQAVDARLQEMRDVFRSGMTESTGRLVYAGGYGAGSRDVERRIGGAKSAYPELSHESASPQAIAAAIESGRGRVYKRVQEAVKREAERQGFKPARKRSRGVLSVAPHEPIRRYCRHCRTLHAKGEHRFHGAGSFHKTHLFSFNPRFRRLGPGSEVRYIRQIGRLRGPYKHPFNSSLAQVYTLRPGWFYVEHNSILIASKPPR